LVPDILEKAGSSQV